MREMDRSPMRAGTPGRRSLLQDLSGSLLGTSLDEEDEERLGFEIELHGDNDNDADLGSGVATDVVKDYNPSNARKYNNLYYDDSPKRKWSATSSSSGESVSPILPTRGRHSKSNSDGDIGRVTRTLGPRKSTPVKSQAAQRNCSDYQLVRSKSDPQYPEAYLASLGDLNDGLDVIETRNGRSHSLIVSGKVSATPKSHSRRGSLIPLNLKQLFGKGHSNDSKHHRRDKGDIPDVPDYAYTLPMTEAESEEDNQGDVEMILPKTQDEEMEFREFYSVVLQTLLHPLGKVDSMKFNPLELVGHLQRIFKVPNALHSTLVKEEINRRPESFVLRVTVVEAKDIKGMDPNGKSDPYCLLTLCNKRVGSPSQGQHHLQVQPQHSRSSSYEPLIKDPAQQLQHANTLPAMTTTGPQGADKGNSNKHLSPQTSLPEASHVHSLQRNITRNRSFNRKDRRRKSLEHLGLGNSKNQVLQQDLHLAVPTDSSLKTHKVSDSGFSPSLPHNNALEEGALYRTSCQKETLHPVWSETFDIELNRLDGELRITMWDLDEETTLWDACKSLDSDHKIAGIKNIFRHMRHGISKCTDDFLGQVIIPLEKIEAATITEDWFRLQRGHARVISSQVTGKLHLKLQFIRKELEAREERHQKALSFYHQLVAAAQKHEAAKHIRSTVQSPDHRNFGPLPQPSLTLLALLNIQLLSWPPLSLPQPPHYSERLIILLHRCQLVMIGNLMQGTSDLMHHNITGKHAPILCTPVADNAPYCEGRKNFVTHRMNLNGAHMNVRTLCLSYRTTNCRLHLTEDGWVGDVSQDVAAQQDWSNVSPRLEAVSPSVMHVTPGSNQAEVSSSATTMGFLSLLHVKNPVRDATCRGMGAVMCPRGAKDSGWDGKLSALTQHVLNQFAVQSGIPRVSQNIIYLSALLDFQIEFDKKNKEAEVTAKNRAKKFESTGGHDEPDSAYSSASSLIRPLPLATGHSSSPSLSSSPTEKKDRQKGEGTPELVRRAAIRRGKTPPGSPSRLSRGEEFDFGLSFDQPLTTSTGKPLVVVNDRMVREALYKIHAEMMAESALTIFGSNPKGVATLFESKPDWLRYETAIVENSISTYIYEILALLPDCAEFYPPTNVPGLESANVKCKLQLLQSLLSMRIWRDHNTPVHRLVSNLMESVVRNDTRRAISNDLDSIPIQDTSLKPVELVDLLDRTTAVINRLTADCKPHKDYKNFFSRFQVDYFATVSLEMDRQVSKFLLNEVLKRLNQYQARYRRFPQNIAESSKASLLLYMAVKQLVAVLKKNLNGHDDLTLWNHNLWFQDPLGYWLMTFQHETFDRVHKALEMDKEVKLVHEVVKYSNSAVDVQACFAKVIQEWQSIGYNCPNSRCMAITKLTDMICEGAKLYACKIHWILEANGFYKTNKAQQFDIKDKLCITLNNIEHVRVYLDNLPALLEWKANCTGLALYHDNKGAGELTLKTLYRLTAAASQDIRVMSAHLERRIAFKMSQEVHRLMDKVVNPDKKVLCEECMEDLLDYIDDNLGTLYKQLMPQIFPQLVQELWQALLQSIKSRVQEGRPPGYYKRLQHSLDSLEAYFQRPGIELTTAQTQTETYHAIMAGLAPNMRSTHDLMADYYRRLATDMATPVAYLGHVSIKIAYHEVAEGLRSLSIKVCNAVDLPGMDRNGLSDPQVTVEICPETSFNKVLSFKTKIVLRELNPVFNEVFQFGALPAEAFASDSVIIAVTVIDHNKLLPNSFIGEAFIPLRQARPITERQTVDHCPAIMLALKRPRRLRGYCQILQNRSRWDKNARQFIAKRTWAIQQQRQRTDKRIESRFSHNAFFPE
ncbi:uncharacterized protein [Diadema antillarum]|uniref:uncharacterized protein n=1 Tax=Diadema antillarum TaxID=105358 RepID=UPI003A8A28CB